MDVIGDAMRGLRAEIASLRGRLELSEKWRKMCEDDVRRLLDQVCHLSSTGWGGELRASLAREARRAGADPTASEEASH